MNEPDPETISQAAAEYYRLRRNFWRCRGGMFACAALAILLLFLLKPWSEWLFGVLILLLLLIFGLCWFFGIAAYFRLLRFRCPRCDKRDWLQHYADGWPEATCKFCQLPARPLPLR